MPERLPEDVDLNGLLLAGLLILLGFVPRPFDLLLHVLQLGGHRLFLGGRIPDLPGFEPLLVRQQGAKAFLAKDRVVTPRLLLAECTRELPKERIDHGAEHPDLGVRAEPKVRPLILVLVGERFSLAPLELRGHLREVRLGIVEGTEHNPRLGCLVDFREGLNDDGVTGELGVAFRDQSPACPGR